MVARALMMVKVAADANNRPQVVDAANIFRAGGGCGTGFGGY